MKHATLGIFTRENLLLLGEKKRGEIGTGTLNGPGGKMNYGENEVECLVRECEEEMGIVLLPDSLEIVAVITFYADGVPDFLVSVFRAELRGEEPVETDDMIPHWFPVDQVPYERMLESDREWFPKALRGERFFANVYYKERARGFEGIEFLPFQEAG